MRFRLFYAVLFVIGLAFGELSGAEPEAIRSIGEIRRLSPEDAERGISATLNAQVMRVNMYRHGTFLFDGHEGLYIEQFSGAGLYDHVKPGDIIEVSGVTTAGGFLPSMRASSLSIVGHQPMPPARKLVARDMNQASLDCQWMSLEGRLVDLTISEIDRSITLSIEMFGGLYNVQIPNFEGELERAMELMFQRVRFNAVAGTVFNEDRQFAGRIFFANSAADMIPTGGLTNEPEFCKIHDLMRVNFDLDKLVTTRGTVIHSFGREIYLRGEHSTVRAVLFEQPDLEPGDIIELTGIAWALPTKPAFRARSFKLVGSGKDPDPVELVFNPVGELYDSPIADRFHEEFVHVDAELLEVGDSFDVSSVAGRNVRTISLLCRSGDHIFEASFSAGDSFDSDSLRIGSHLSLKGISHLILNDEVSWKVKAERFSLQLRGREDIQILKLASWWTTKHLLWVTAAMASVLGLSLVWIVSLRRTVGRQTTVIAEKVEQESVLNERQRIARELHDNLEQGLAGMAIQLKGCRELLEVNLSRSTQTLKQFLQSVFLEANWSLKS